MLLMLGWWEEGGRIPCIVGGAPLAVVAAHPESILHAPGCMPDSSPPTSGSAARARRDVTEPWAQRGRMWWVRDSPVPPDPKGVKIGRKSVQETSAPPSENGCTIG